MVVAFSGEAYLSFHVSCRSQGMQSLATVRLLHCLGSYSPILLPVAPVWSGRTAGLQLAPPDVYLLIRQCELAFIQAAAPLESIFSAQRSQCAL